MAIWLGKTDPDTLSISDIEKDGTKLWKKVRHPKGMQFMTDVKIGDKLLVYHSNEKKIVGVTQVLSNEVDPDHPRGRLINVKFIEKFKEPLVSLEDVKKSGEFKDFRLVWEPRLSFMDVPEKFLRYFKINI